MWSLLKCETKSCSFEKTQPQMQQKLQKSLFSNTLGTDTFTPYGEIKLISSAKIVNVTRLRLLKIAVGGIGIFSSRNCPTHFHKSRIMLSLASANPIAQLSFKLLDTKYLNYYPDQYLFSPSVLKQFESDLLLIKVLKENLLRY